MCDASHWEETIAEQSPKYQLATPPSCQGFGPGLQKTPGIPQRGALSLNKVIFANSFVGQNRVRLYVFGLPSSCSSSSSSGVFLWTAAFEARVCGEMSISWPRCLLSPIHAAQWDGGLVPCVPYHGGRVTRHQATLLRSSVEQAWWLGETKKYQKIKLWKLFWLNVGPSLPVQKITAF